MLVHVLAYVSLAFGMGFVQAKLVKLIERQGEGQTIFVKDRKMDIPPIDRVGVFAPYIACNLFKTFVMFGLACTPYWWNTTISIFNLSQDHLWGIMVLGQFYGAADGSAIFVNWRRIDNGSLAHHALTFGSGVLFMWVYPSPSLIRYYSAIIWFGIMSIPTYLVNFYLALRKIPFVTNSSWWRLFVWYSTVLYCIFFVLNCVVLPIIMWHTDIETQVKVVHTFVVCVLVRVDWTLLSHMIGIVNEQKETKKRKSVGCCGDIADEELHSEDDVTTWGMSG